MSRRLVLLAAPLSLLLIACGSATSTPSPAAPSSNPGAAPAPSASALAVGSDGVHEAAVKQFQRRVDARFAVAAEPQ